MKRILILATALGALVALADNNVGTWVKVKSETTAVANTLATNVAALTPTSGVDFNGGGGVAAAICAEATRTISSGNVRAYIYMSTLEKAADAGVGTDMLWVPYAPLDIALATGNRCALTGDKQSLTGLGRIAWVEDDVAVSAGTTVVVTYTRRLGQPVVNH